jgi:hypothetical protein
MMRIKKVIAVVVVFSLFSAAALVSCSKQSGGEHPAGEHPADTAQQASDSTEHPAGEHPSDSTQN